MASQNYDALTDEAAKVAIRNAIRFAAGQPGATPATISAHLQKELGITGVAMDFDPGPDQSGSLQAYRRHDMGRFMFMAHGPSGKTITG